MDMIISLFISFFAGGGLMMVVNYRLHQKTAKIDYADKAINFMERQNSGLMSRVNALELKVNQLSEQLSKWRCDRPDCQNRLK